MNALSAGKYLAHLSNLMVSFGSIGLIDTQRIDPVLPFYYL
jgi:hypothetical protein